MFPQRKCGSIPILRDIFLFGLAALFLLVVSPLRGQDSTNSVPDGMDVPDSLFAVDSVRIGGNEHTEEMVILREMTLKPGALITAGQMKFDQERIYSLGLFNRVQMHIAPTAPGRANLYVDVVERWFIIPYPIFGLKEGDWSKIYAGLGLMHSNFRGRDEKLFLNGALGYDPFGSFSYRNPFLDSAGTYYFEGRIAFNRVRNRSLQALVHPTDVFDEKHFSLSGTIGKRLDNFVTLWVSAEYRAITVNDYVKPVTLSPTGSDKFPIFSAGYSYDTRDLGEYTSHGTMVRFSASKYGMPGKDLDFIRYGFDLRQYIPLEERWSLAGRVGGNLLAGGNSPDYSHVFLSYDYHVRGHYRDVVEGENILGATAELHYTLIPPFYYHVSMLPSQFGVLKFGVTLAAFADAGTVWYRGDKLATENVLRGYGVGIHFAFAYSFILRTEYAINESRRGEFIIDLGAAL